MSKIVGYIVMEHAEDFEQALVLRTDPGFPPGGLLDWGREAKALFPDRKSAREAINRTEHYRLAFNEPTRWPERKFCVILPVRAVKP